MKRLNLIVLGLLTLSLMILTDKIDLSLQTDKLLCTILWLGWLISALAVYLFNTQNWRFSHSANGGWMLGLAVALQNDKYTKAISFVIPFIVLEFKWTKAN